MPNALLSIFACAAPPAESPPAMGGPPNPATSATEATVPPEVTEAMCGPDLVCVDAASIGVFLDYSGEVEIGDLDGDGLADLATSTGAYRFPAAGDPLGAPFATWSPYFLHPSADWNGDGIQDACSQHGILLGPFSGVVEGQSRFPAAVCDDADVTGDGIADHVQREAPDGDLVLRAGPFATPSSPVTASIHFTSDAADPTYDACSWGGYSFFDWNDVPGSVYVADLEGGAGAQMVVSFGGWWDPAAGALCPLAEPLVLFGSADGLAVDVGPAGIGPFVASAAAPVGLPDVDGDGSLDFLAGEQVFRGPAVVVDGALDLSSPLGQLPWWLTAIPDVDGDGRADVLVAQTDALVIFAGDGAGGVDAPLIRIAADDLRTEWWEPEWDVLELGIEGTSMVRLSDLQELLAAAP